MKERQLNSTDHPITFLMVSSSDGKTGLTGLSPIINLAKDGGIFYLASGTVSEMNYGWYSLAGNSFDRNTLGELAIHASGAGADITDDKYVIVPWNPFEKNQGLNALSGIDTTLPTLTLISGVIENSWTNTQSELGNIPQFPASRNDMLTFQFERSHNKTQTTGSGDYIFKSDGTTILGSGQLFDDGVTFTRNKYV